MNWHNVILRPRNLYEELLRRKLISGGGVPAVLQTVTGISPLTLLNVARKGIESLTQFGKCEQASSPTPSVPVDIKCNNGTIKAKHESGLPIEYQKVEYIKSSATQYINTGYVPDGNEIIELTFDLVNLPIQSKWIVLFGEREQAASTSQTNYWLGINNTGALYSRFGTVNASSQPTLTSGTTYNIKVDVPNRTLYVNNDSYTFTDSVISDITKSIFLGNINAPVGATLNLGGTANYRSMKITKNDNILHNFIPCYRKSDNEAGLYDIVTNTFSANAGTGAFTVGSDVADPVEVYADGTPEVLTICEKNLCPNKSYAVNNNSTQIGSDDADAYPFYFVGGTTYTVSYSATKKMKVYLKKDADQSGLLQGESQTSVSFIPADSGWYRIVLNNANGYASANVTNIQIEVGSTATDYEAYSEQTASVVNLFGVGDYKDEQEIINGAVTRSCGIKVLDGTEEWTTDTYGGYRRMVLQEVLTASGDTLSVICSHYVSRSSDARQQPNSIFIAGSGKTVIYVGSSQNITTADEFNAWLATQYANGTPVIILYPLAETTTEQVTAQHLTARDTATITAQTNNISDITLEVQYWENAE